MVLLALRLLLVSIAAYVLIALFQTLFLELLLGGRVAPDAAWFIQLGGLAGTVVSGLVGGYVVARLGGEQPWLHTAAVLVLLSLDTVSVLAWNHAGHPLWFNLAGSATLMGATVAGCWLRAGAAATRARPG